MLADVWCDFNDLSARMSVSPKGNEKQRMKEINVNVTLLKNQRKEMGKERNKIWGHSHFKEWKKETGRKKEENK